MYVYYFHNRGNYCPSDTSHLKSIIKSKLHVRPIIVRVSSREVQVYTPRSLISKEIERLTEILGSRSEYQLTYYYSESIEELYKWYKILLQLERFWEAHELGERIWRLGFPGGQLLAVIAGLFARAQEGIVKPVLSILYRILPSVLLSQAGVSSRIVLSRLETTAYSIASCGSPSFEWYTSLISSLNLISYRRK